MSYYKELGSEISVFDHSYNNKLPLMLKGPTGCGKSRYVESMAVRYNKPLVHVVCNEETSSVDLIGRYIIKGSNTIWQDGPVSRSVRNNCFLYLDEISEAREDVLVIIHPLTDYRRQIYIDKTNETLTASSNFMLIVSFNPEYQHGFRNLKPSTRQRFLSLQFNYPNFDDEVDIICNESKVDIKIAKLLVKYGQKIRNLKELELSETVSTRLLINAGKLILSGLNVHLVCNIAINHVLTDDIEMQKALFDIVKLIFK